MPSDILDVVLLFSLPASGKSETRTYMSSLEPAQCVRDMAMGPTLQLDDYPYVHFMHRIDDELRKLGQPYLFYLGPNRPFQDQWTWATLVNLLNEDFDDLVAGRCHDVPSAAQLLFDRIDRARGESEQRAVLGDIPYRARMRLAAALEKECRDNLEERNQQVKLGTAGRTIVIEAARGGPNGTGFPITPPQGYGATFQQLDPRILERACVLYIWVDPAESRRKNIERGLPDGQGSILHHSVPMEVMLSQYATDDMAWLMEQSDKPDTIKVERIMQQGGRYLNRAFYLPAARFDNRTDKTSFIRKEKSAWTSAEIRAIHDELSRALKTLRRVRNAL